MKADIHTRFLHELSDCFGNVGTAAPKSRLLDLKLFGGGWQFCGFWCLFGRLELF